jgi:hypothetical protein
MEPGIIIAAEKTPLNIEHRTPNVELGDRVPGSMFNVQRSMFEVRRHFP